MCAIALGPTPYEQHRDYVLKVLGRRCAWLDRADREALYHDAYALLLEKERSGELRLDTMHLQQVRAYLVQTALYKALDEGKRAERKRAVPLGDEALAADDGARALEDALVEGFDAARVREIVDELPERRRAIVKLRYYMDCAPSEIQALLGLRERVYRRELERAMRQIAEHYELVRDGTFCDSRRSMVMAYVAGLSGPERARKAQAHIASCPGCRAFAVQLRDAARDVAVALPLPAFELRDGLVPRIIDGLAAARDHVADLLAGAKQQALVVTTRVDTGTAGMAGAARPGTVAAAVAGCLAVGGGATYCVVEGLPAPVRTLLSDEPKRERRAEQQSRRAAAQAQPAAARPAAAPATTQAASTPSAGSSSAQPAAGATRARAKPKPKPKPKSATRRRPANVAPVAPDPVEDEFGMSGSGTPVQPQAAASQPAASSSSGSSSSSPAASAPPPPPPASSSNEFDP